MERDDRVTHVGHGPGMTVSSFGRARFTVPKGQRRGMAKPAIRYGPALASLTRRLADERTIRRVRTRRAGLSSPPLPIYTRVGGLLQGPPCADNARDGWAATCWVSRRSTRRRSRSLAARARN